MIVQHCAALRTEQLARERIGLACAVRSSSNMENILSQFPFVLGNDGIMRVLEDQPFLLWPVLTLRLQAVLYGAEIDSVAHILWPSKDVADSYSVPGIGLAHVSIGTLHTVLMNCVVIGWTRYAFF